ncbi:hypothetical protein [Amycolatopsis keratiniphila]|nr:hypothetical protein [Amycolatopsis keratiniphila]
MRRPVQQTRVVLGQLAGIAREKYELDAKRVRHPFRGEVVREFGVRQFLRREIEFACLGQISAQRQHRTAQPQVVPAHQRKPRQPRQCGHRDEFVVDERHPPVRQGRVDPPFVTPQGNQRLPAAGAQFGRERAEPQPFGPR